LFNTSGSLLQQRAVAARYRRIYRQRVLAGRAAELVRSPDFGPVPSTYPKHWIAIGFGADPSYGVRELRDGDRGRLRPAKVRFSGFTFNSLPPAFGR